MKLEEIAAKIIIENPSIFEEYKNDNSDKSNLIRLLRNIKYQAYIFERIPSFKKVGNIYKFYSFRVAKQLTLAGFSVFARTLEKDLIFANYTEFKIFIDLRGGLRVNEFLFIKSYQFEKLTFLFKHK